MALSEMAVRNAKKRTSAYKMADGNGLYLLVTTSGAKSWRFDYRRFHKRQTLTFGLYPDVSLGQARDHCRAARSALSAGQDPKGEKKKIILAAKLAAGNTFQVVAEEWFETKLKSEGRSQATLDKNTWFLKLAYPEIGERPIHEIEPPEILDMLLKIQDRGKHETATRMRSAISRVFRYAIATARAKRDPAADLIGALTSPKRTHHAAILDPVKVGELLREIDAFEGTREVRAAMQLAPLVFVRPVELRKAEWSEFDWDKAVWRIPAAKMKMRKEHLVPLSRQAMEILNSVRKLQQRGKYLFSSLRTPNVPMSENTINAALRRMGYPKEEQTGHGFRTIASTFLNEMGWNPDWIERQLAHVDEDESRRSYNAAQWLPDRTRMMQAWADHLDALKSGAQNKSDGPADQPGSKRDNGSRTR